MVVRICFGYFVYFVFFNRLIICEGGIIISFVVVMG